MTCSEAGTELPDHLEAPAGPGAILFESDPASVFPPARTGDLLVAVHAALAGGRATLPYYRSASLRTAEKSPGDPVTEADHAANRAVLSILGRERPDDPVLSEESPPPGSDSSSERLWVVDPLDGTREFIDGIDEFAVMVGLAERGAASLGAFFVPGSRRLYAGVADGGAWIADCSMGEATNEAIVVGAFHPLRVGRPTDDRVRLVRSRSHPDDRLRAIEQALPSVEVIPSGSVGVKCARIAERAADLYVHPVPYLKEWDTCAPEAVLRGAGGRVTDCGGRALRYGKPDPRQPSGILAGDPVSWAAALPLVREVSEPIL
ncbi:MAG: 3'(2'),5'-bisphosphate nucleotidase CysQ [Candidatus Palauibacterales bacterium]|nr:3'(2'),5'-bisphosphate nucleotidase CysQ [Candidatus Palauibacterales bacterium]MDP2483428.1 3'(2'),5'-bisphosphate nucleotidase CysQ [Candidatus Palauibacterales bacterium]